jgi:regulator of CtrA degradation
MSEREVPVSGQAPVVRSVEAIAFGEKFAGSETFKALFREGMTLVEQTAGYLDGEGRTDSKQLGRTASLAYATESMRLTTRLMQLASWLLLQRAANEGEMTEERVKAEKAKVRLKGFETNVDGPHFKTLPPTLQELILRSQRLQERVQTLDLALFRSETPPAADNPVGRQLGRLSEAFGRRE